MKGRDELIIRSSTYTNVEVYLLNNELTYLQLDYSELDKSNKGTTTIDNNEYTYEIFKVLLSADKMGVFDKIKEKEEQEEKGIPTVYI